MAHATIDAACYPTAASAMSHPSFRDIDPPANYLLRHWRGEIPLVQSFWANGVTVWLCYWMIVALLGPHYSIYGVDDELGFLRRGLTLLYYPVSVWQLVGISRAATRYQREGGVAAWAGLAQGVVILGSFLLFARVVFWVLF
jgi:hypothetical protein